MDLRHRAASSKKRLDFVLRTFLMPLAWISSPVAACWRHRESAFVTLTSAVKHSDHVDCTHPPNPTHITFADVVAACPFVVRPKLVLSKDLQGSTVRTGGRARWSNSTAGKAAGVGGRATAQLDRLSEQPDSFVCERGLASLGFSRVCLLSPCLHRSRWPAQVALRWVTCTLLCAVSKSVNPSCSREHMCNAIPVLTFRAIAYSRGFAGCVQHVHGSCSQCTLRREVSPLPVSEIIHIFLVVITAGL